MEAIEPKKEKRHRPYVYSKKNNERSKEWAKAHPEKQKEIRKRGNSEYYWRRRNAVFEKLGWKCVGCGIEDGRILCIDHVHGGGTKEKHTLSYAKIIDKILSDTEGNYQILCHNCNWIKRYENREHYSNYWDAKKAA